jgi:hypothetical protein
MWSSAWLRSSAGVDCGDDLGSGLDLDGAVAAGGLDRAGALKASNSAIVTAKPTLDDGQKARYKEVSSQGAKLCLIVS